MKIYFTAITAIVLSAIVACGGTAPPEVATAAPAVDNETVSADTDADVLDYTASATDEQEDELDDFEIRKPIGSPEALGRRCGGRFDCGERPSTPPESAVAAEDYVKANFELLEDKTDKLPVLKISDIVRSVPAGHARKEIEGWQGNKPSGKLAGAHIEAKNHRPETYIIIAANAQETTLTHELGHLFGLSHKKDPTNMMSYGNKRTTFSDAQLETIRKKAERLVRKKMIESEL